MIQEDKQMLLKDLCGRLPYGIKFSWKGDKDYNIFTLEDIGSIMKYAIVEEGKILPYLRSMSSMTEEEIKEYDTTFVYYGDCPCYTIETFDFLNKKHFDYRGLIPMGLAIEAPEGMYVIK